MAISTCKTTPAGHCPDDEDEVRSVQSMSLSSGQSSEEIRVGSESVTVTVGNLGAINTSVSQISSQTSDMTLSVTQQSEVTQSIGGSMQTMTEAIDLAASEIAVRIRGRVTRRFRETKF